MDPNEPLGLYLQLYPFFLPPPPEPPPPSDSKEIQWFSLQESKSFGIINGKNISVTVPFGSSVNSKTPNFFHTGSSVEKDGVLIQPGQTSLDFTAKQILKIIAEDSTFKDYEITVSQGLSNSKDILNFQFDDLDSRGVITGTSIVVNLPFGTDTTNLSPTFSHSGKAVYAMEGATLGAEQIPRESRRDFTDTKVYRVEANDTTTKDYSVVVKLGTDESNTVEDISIDGSKGTIVGDIIYFIFPSNKNLSALPILLSHLGKSARINNQLHKNGESLYDLRNTLSLVIEANNGTIRTYSIRSGVSIPPGTIPPSFTDNGNQTITDNNTGLVWMRCILSNVPGVPRTGDWCVTGTRGAYPFCNTASNDCNGGKANGVYGDFLGGSSENSNTAWRACNLANSNPTGGFGGRTNWRVPSLSEMQSIIDYEGLLGSAGKPYRTYFPMGSGSGEYNFYTWTSSTFAVGTTLSYHIWGTTGAVETINKTTLSAVRCVSTGP